MDIILAEAQKRECCAILCYHEELSTLSPTGVIDIGKQDDLKTQATRLFAALRHTDDLDCQVIYAHLPTTDGIGLALYNRLIRAAAHTVKKIDNKTHLQ